MEKAINKVILGDTTLMDISEDTVTEDNLLEGVTAHAADGTQITGKVVVAEIVDSLEDQSTDKALSARQGYVLDQKIYKPEYTSFDKTKEPTEYSDIDLMTSGQVLPTILGKVTLMLKNIRYFFKLIGSTDISSIGDGTLTGALSTLNSNFEKSNMVCKTIDIYDNTMIFSLKHTSHELMRLPIFVFACGQNGFVGMYSIIAFYNRFLIQTISGTSATITDNGNGTVTLTFSTTNIWGTGFIIAPKSII